MVAALIVMACFAMGTLAQGQGKDDFQNFNEFLDGNADAKGLLAHMPQSAAAAEKAWTGVRDCVNGASNDVISNVKADVIKDVSASYTASVATIKPSFVEMGSAVFDTPTPANNAEAMKQAANAAAAQASGNVMDVLKDVTKVSMTAATLVAQQKVKEAINTFAECTIERLTAFNGKLTSEAAPFLSNPNLADDVVASLKTVLESVKSAFQTAININVDKKIAQLKLDAESTSSQQVTASLQTLANPDASQENSGTCANGLVCKNSGKCVNSMCQCTPEWTGQDCSTSADACNSVNCNEGRCANIGGKPLCICPVHAMGEFCEQQTQLEIQKRSISSKLDAQRMKMQSVLSNINKQYDTVATKVTDLLEKYNQRKIERAKRDAELLRQLTQPITAFAAVPSAATAVHTATTTELTSSSTAAVTAALANSTAPIAGAVNSTASKVSTPASETIAQGNQKGEDEKKY